MRILEYSGIYSAFYVLRDTFLMVCVKKKASVWTSCGEIIWHTASLTQRREGWIRKMVLMDLFLPTCWPEAPAAETKASLMRRWTCRRRRERQKWVSDGGNTSAHPQRAALLNVSERSALFLALKTSSLTHRRRQGSAGVGVLVVGRSWWYQTLQQHFARQVIVKITPHLVWGLFLKSSA